MKIEKNTKQLLFLEPVNKFSDEEEVLKRLIKKLKALGFNIIEKEEEQNNEN